MVFVRMDRLRADRGVFACVVDDLGSGSVARVGGDSAITPRSDLLSSLAARDASAAPVVDLALGRSDADRAQGEDGVLLGEALAREACSEPFGPGHDAQYADSDSDVKTSLPHESESCTAFAPTLQVMGAHVPKDEPGPLAEFVRLLIQRWEDEGKTLRALKIAAEWPKTNSQVDQIKAGSSVTEYSGSKLAKPLGYKDFPDLVAAAYAWWRAGRKAIPKSEAETPLAEAIRIARGYAVTQAQIERAIAGVPAVAQAGLDALTWLAMFHDQKSLDARIDADLRAAAHVATHERARAEAARAEVREAASAKKRAASAKTRRKAG